MKNPEDGGAAAAEAVLAAAAAADPAQRFSHLRQLAGKALRASGCLAMGILPGAGAGAGAGAGIATTESVHVEVLPGVSADARLIAGDTSRISFGKLGDYACFNDLPRDILAAVLTPQQARRDGGSLDLPAVHSPVIAGLNVGVQAKITGINCSTENIQALAGVFDNTKTAEAVIAQPLSAALTRQLIRSVEAWGITGGAATLAAEGILLSLRRRKSGGADGQQDALQPAGLRGRALVGTAIGLSGIMAGAGLFSVSGVSAPRSNLAINTDITARSPFLAGASVSSGSLLAQLEQDLNQVLQEKDRIDKYYVRTEQNLQAALLGWRQDPANRALLAQANLIPVVSMAGRHCSFPTGQILAPEVMSIMKPLLIIDTGNVDVSDGTLPFENYCVTLLQQTIQAAVNATGQKVSLWAADGSHDNLKITGTAEAQVENTGPDGKPYHSVTVFGLNNKGVVTSHGLTGIGAASPRQNADGQPTEVNGQPATPQQQNMALYQAGQLGLNTCLAENAKGITPVAVFNSREQGYTLLNNCSISSEISGEGPTGFFTYSHSGNQANVIVEGSSAGNGIECTDFWPYQEIAGNAQYIFYLMDPATNQIAYYANLLINQDGQVAISRLQPITANPYNPNVVSRFLDSRGSALNSPDDNKVGNPAAC
jgi:hypothetical protein